MDACVSIGPYRPFIHPASKVGFEPKGTFGFESGIVRDEADPREE